VLHHASENDFAHNAMNVNHLSFDPAHPWFAVPGLPGAEWAVEIFTTENVYGIDPAKSRFDGSTLAASGLRWLGGQRGAVGAVTVRAGQSRDGATNWTITARASELIKSVKLLLRKLPVEISSGGWWTPTTSAASSFRPTSDRPLLLTYPWASAGDGWQTPWVCAGDGPGLAISVRDSLVRAKRFYAYRPHWAQGEVVEVVCTAAASSRRNSFESPEIRLRVCADESEVRRDFNDHLASIEANYGLTRWEERHDAPAWADDLDLVLTLHGQHWTGFVFNTFDQMAAVLQDVCEAVRGERLLAYLPGWEGRYYWQYPIYRPGEDLGGEAGFARLVATARTLGVHLMPMFGANGANVRRYPQWENAAFRSPSDRYVELVNKPDWDSDRVGEDEQVFLNPGEPNFRHDLVDQITAVVDRYGVEGVFLDTSACWFDDPRHDVYQGYRDLVNELHGHNPDLLLCGEGWYDALLSIFPMNQTWIDMTNPPRFADLPLRYSRLLGHLNYGAPGNGSTGVHERGTNPLAVPLRRNGFVPALPIVNDTLTLHRSDVLAFCRAVARERL
jgi:hypothetical protein